MKGSEIDYGDERLALFVMEIYEAFAQQTERNQADLNDVELEDGILKVNGEFDVWRIAQAIMNGTS